jgi:carboxymethylenebutenolidase
LFLAGALALPLATILANVDLAEAQAAKGVSINQTTADGRTVSAYFAKTDKKDAPVVILIHELWGLNDNIKTMAKISVPRVFMRLPLTCLTGQCQQ